MPALLAFHNDAKIKAKYLRRIRRHAKLDELVKGSYWENGKGCAVGCIIHGDDHAKFATEMGIPTALARILDRCFEGSSNEYAKALPVRFVAAARPGADLSGVVDRLMLWVVESVAKHNKSDAAKAANATVQKLYTRKIAGDAPTVTEWREARTATYAAADATYVTTHAATAAAADATYAATHATYVTTHAATAAADATYAATHAADATYAATAAIATATTARRTYYEALADKMIELMEAA